MDSINTRADSELDSSDSKQDESSVTQIYWLCGLARFLLDITFSFSPSAVFEDRTTSLLYAYSLSVCPSVPDGHESEIGSIRGKDERSPDDPDTHFLNYQNFLTVGGKSLHFFAKSGWEGMYVVVIPVEVNQSMEGSAVELNIKVSLLVPLRCKIQYVISEVKRVDSIVVNQTAQVFSLNAAQYRIKCVTKIISSILPYPPRLHLEPNIYKRSVLSKCEHSGSLYRPDIICQLDDILTKLFRKVNVNHCHIPLQCIERIASFLSIEDVVAVIHLDYPDSFFDRRVLKGDIIICFPNIVAPLPLKSLFSKNFIRLYPEENLRTCFRKFISGELPKNSEEFWILLNESMVSPCAYRKNDIKTDGRSKLSFIIPTRQQEGVVENAIRKVRSFLFEKTGIVENKVISIMTVNEFEHDELYFQATLIKAVFSEEGGCCSWYITSDDRSNHNNVTAALRIDLQEFEILFHIQERICRTEGEVIMLTDDSRGSEEFVKGVEPLCKTRRFGKSSSDEETDFAITRQSDLVTTLAESLDGFAEGIAVEGDVPSVLPKLWKIIADTFGISNYSIIGSQDAPCPVPTDLVVLIHWEQRPDLDLDLDLQAASVKCIRNNKLTIASQYVNQKGDQNKNSVPPDDETVHDLKIAVLIWDTDSTGNWKVWAERATASLSASGKVLDWRKCSESKECFKYESSSEELNIFFASLKCSRLQVQFLMHDS